MVIELILPYSMAKTTIVDIIMNRRIRQEEEERRKNQRAYFHEIALLSIMHCQHDNGFSVVILLNHFSFLPYTLQRFIFRFCSFFLLKRILLFDLGAIPSPPVLQIICQLHTRLYYSSIETSFAKS